MTEYMFEKDKELILRYLVDISNNVNRITKEIDKSFVHKMNHENVLIHDICNIDIDVNKFEEKFNLYYSIACPKFDCKFIFDHPLDHYSFILLMEIGRQMSIGVTHKFKSIPLDKFKDIIKHVNFKIHNFVELDYPLIVGCVDKIIKNKPTMQIRELYFLYVQKNNICAEVSTMITVLSNDLYTRCRCNNRRSVVGSNDVSLITNLDMINTNNGK
jgi:hypothetical protein